MSAQIIDYWAARDARRRKKQEEAPQLPGICGTLRVEVHYRPWEVEQRKYLLDITETRGTAVRMPVPCGMVGVQGYLAWCQGTAHARNLTLEIVHVPPDDLSLSS